MDEIRRFWNAHSIVTPEVSSNRRAVVGFEIAVHIWHLITSINITQGET